MSAQQKAAMQIANNEKNPLLNNIDNRIEADKQSKGPNCPECFNKMNKINAIYAHKHKQETMCSQCDYAVFSKNEFLYQCPKCNTHLCISCGRYTTADAYPDINASYSMKLTCYADDCKGNDEKVPENKWFLCDGCGFSGYSTETMDGICARFICFLHKTDELPYTLCEQCRCHRLYLQYLQENKPNKYYANEKVDDCDIHHLYYLYVNGKNTGPYSLQDLKKMYVSKQLGYNDDKLYIIGADGVDPTISYDLKWVPIVFPSFVKHTLRASNPKRCKLLKRLDSENYRLSKRYKNVYNGLIRPILSGKLRQVELPKDIPFDMKHISEKWYLRIIQLIGRMIAYFLVVVIVLHCLPMSIVWCMSKMVNVFRKTKNPKISKLIVFVAAYSGMIFTPLVIVGISLEFEWDNITPWMIAYLIWGMCSYFMSVTYRLSLFMGQSVDAINTVIFFLTGIEFSEIFDIEKDIQNSSVVMILFPSLGSLFFAVLGWYISDFFITERFSLDCNEFEEASDDTFCVETAHGCCHIQSSQDINRSYIFISSLGGASVSIWAFIRFVGYALLNKYPKLSMYTKPPS